MPDEETRRKLASVFDREGPQFSFNEGRKHIVNPVIIAPDEELPVQDTEFVQPALGETFEMGRKKAKEVLRGLEEQRDGSALFTRGAAGLLEANNG